MIKEIFLGSNPSKFDPNPVVKAFIVSEVLLWSGWNFIVPIFAVFATSEVSGGSVEIAASAYSTYLIARVFAELGSGRYLMKAKESKKFVISIIGISLISFAYLGFSMADRVILLYVFYALAGIGLGIASPAKNSLFAMHLDKHKEATEWGMYDALVFTGTALASALGGFIATEYGFPTLFIIAAIVNALSTIPYILFIHHKDSIWKQFFPSPLEKIVS